MAIFFDSTTKTFYLEGKSSSYVFYINNCGYAEHLHYGKKIGRDDITYTRTFGGRATPAGIPGNDSTLHESYHFFQTELAFFGNSDFREPTVQVTNVEGDRLCELLYDSYEILPEKPKMQGMPSLDGGETLVVHLKDKVTSFAADMYYTVYDDNDVVARRIVYKNGRDCPITLDRAYSFALSLPRKDYDVMTLHGAWGVECQIDKTPLLHGVVSVDSKRTMSSAVLNPFMALLSKGATETLGEAYGVSLVYSSSFVLKAEGGSDGQTTLTGGINDFDFAWKLGAGESFETPEVVLAYSSEGIGQMSRCFHDAFRDHLICKRFAKLPHPIVINNWEGTYFNFTNDKLKAIASAVEGTGIDTFVLDDGWFGVRDTDSTGLGDWWVNETKMPGGLKPIIDHVNSLGMKFGLWFEPEMISEDSDIYRAHPEYAIGVPNREHCYCRHQFVMDLTREDVRDYIVESVNKVLHENHIEYVKWDYNRCVTESCSAMLEPERQKEFAHRYALGLYDLCERIVEANPTVFFEGCSSGGGRFDPAILYYFPQIWTSDDSDAEARTQIQYGTSTVYPPSAMSCHISEVPNHQTGRVTPMKTRADIAHLGATGYELDASSFTDEDREITRAQVAEYKEIEDLVLLGDLYRVADPFTSNFFGFMLVSKDKSRGYLTYYRRICSANCEVERVTAAGLDPDKSYYIRELDKTLKGSTIMNVGIVADFGFGDFITKTYHFEER